MKTNDFIYCSLFRYHFFFDTTLFLLLLPFLLSLPFFSIAPFFAIAPFLLLLTFLLSPQHITLKKKKIRVIPWAPIYCSFSSFLLQISCRFNLVGSSSFNSNNLQLIMMVHITSLNYKVIS